MRKCIFAILLIFLAAFVFASDLRMDSTNYSPAPAIPGRYIDFYIYIKNYSTVVAQDSMVIIDLQRKVGTSTFPFSLDAGVNEKINLGDITAGKTVTAEYRINVAPEALNGNYTIKIKFGDEDSPDREVEKVIMVEARNPQLEIIDSSVDEVLAGESINIDLTVRNVGYTAALDTLIGLEADRTVTSTGVVVEREISSMGASSDYISEIEPNAQKIANIKVAVNPEAEQKIYMVPIELRYKDGNANDYSVTRYIGIKVSQPAELDAVISDSIPAPYAGGTSEITVDLFNIGAGEARYVVAELAAEIGEIPLAKNFIGTLEDDDFDSFRTKIKIKDGTAAGDYPISLALTYKTEFGKTETLLKTLSLKVVSQEDAAASAQPMSIWFYVVVLIVLFVVGRWVYRKARKRNK